MTNLLDFPVEVRLTGDFCSIFISYRLKSFIHNQKNDDEYIEPSVHLHEFILIVNFIAYGRQPYEIGMGNRCSGCIDFFSSFSFENHYFVSQMCGQLQSIQQIINGCHSIESARVSSLFSVHAVVSPFHFFLLFFHKTLFLRDSFDSINSRIFFS